MGGPPHLNEEVMGGLSYLNEAAEPANECLCIGVNVSTSSIRASSWHVAVMVLIQNWENLNLPVSCGPGPGKSNSCVHNTVTTCST